MARPAHWEGRSCPAIFYLSISSDGFACLAELSGNPTRPSPSSAGFRKDRRLSPVVEGATTYAVRDIPAVSGIVRRHIKRGFTMSIKSPTTKAKVRLVEDDDDLFVEPQRQEDCQARRREAREAVDFTGAGLRCVRRR